jgi:ABC-2 type transport system permease protein
MNTFKWLLKREYWENRGGFFWAPLLTSVIYLFFHVFGLILAAFGIREASEHNAEFNLSHGMAELADPEHAADVSRVIESVFMGLGAPVLLVLAFVVFFYCLGSLFDDRKDRSILFWKSLPISDTQTVLSKVVMALFVAPAIATAFAILTSFAILIVTSIFVLAHGANPMYFWDFGAIAKACINLVAALPIYALWALPTVGWLMLCSAFFRRVPFIWAVLVPLLTGIMILILGIGAIVEKSVSWFWIHVVVRVLTSTIPGSEIPYRLHWFPAQAQIEGPQDLANIFSIGSTYSVMAMPAIWIGAVIGIAMIYAAIQLRGRSDEG